MIAIYNAVKEEINENIAFYLSLFIALILFTIILISIDAFFIQDLLFKNYINLLTSGFIIVIVLSIIILAINLILTPFKKSNQN